jgi:uncharacterized protein YgiM (DUF1202 family)
MHVAVIVLGAALVMSLGFNAWQAQQSAQEQKLMKGEITDLRYQVEQDRLAANGSSATPQPSVAATPEPTAAPTPTPVLGDATAAGTATVSSSAGYANLRRGAGTNTAFIKRLNNGTVVNLGASDSAGWQEVTIDGEHGYIKKDLLKY